MINVLVVDDNGPVRESLRHLIETAQDLKLIATARNGVEVVDKARSYRPDVAVMDISMPLMDGIQATGHIGECRRLRRVIILSGFDAPEYVRRALDVGAKGYVIKEAAGTDLLEGIRTVHAGRHFFSPQISGIGESYLSER